jgi:hypothetical protein
VFGFSGAGEGAVFYPISLVRAAGRLGVVGMAEFSQFAFKAKGNTHRSKITGVPVALSVTVAKSVDEFVQMFVTRARLDQGGEEYDIALAQQAGDDAVIAARGEWIEDWIAADVRKESTHEFAALIEWQRTLPRDQKRRGRLDWEQVETVLRRRTRAARSRQELQQIARPHDGDSAVTPANGGEMQGRRSQRRASQFTGAFVPFIDVCDHDMPTPPLFADGRREA